MPKVVIKTKIGTVTINLREDVAPKTCEVVKKLAADGSYTGCCFYRAEPGFVVQGGLRTASGQTRPNRHGKVPLEYSLPNKRGTVTMARWDQPNTGDGEFFVNLGENKNLDKYGDSGWALGFAVFGELADAESMRVVETIATQPTTSKGGLKMLNSPVTFETVSVVP